MIIEHEGLTAYIFEGGPLGRSVKPERQYYARAYQCSAEGCRFETRMKNAATLEEARKAAAEAWRAHAKTKHKSLLRATPAPVASAAGGGSDPDETGETSGAPAGGSAMTENIAPDVLLSDEFLADLKAAAGVRLSLAEDIEYLTSEYALASIACARAPKDDQLTARATALGELIEVLHLRALAALQSALAATAQAQAEVKRVREQMQDMAGQRNEAQRAERTAVVAYLRRAETAARKAEQWAIAGSFAIVASNIERGEHLAPAADTPAQPLAARDGGDCTAEVHGPACNGIHYPA